MNDLRLPPLPKRLHSLQGPSVNPSWACSFLQNQASSSHQQNTMGHKDRKNPHPEKETTKNINKLLQTKLILEDVDT